MSRRSSTRRRELVQVVGALIAILVGTAVVSRMLVAAWDAHGLVFHLMRGAARAIGFGIDGLVVFAAFLVLTWVVFFTLDDDKHVQGALLLLATFLVFVPSLVLMDRWAGTVDFLAHPVAMMSGVIVGLAVVAVDANVPPLQGGGRFRFPMAAKSLYAVTVLVLIVGYFERHLVYQSPIVVIEWAAEPGQTTGGLFSPFVDAIGVFGVIYLVGYFVRYSDVSNVAISSPDEETVASFLGGLYGEADYLYGARAVEGGHILNSARSARHSQPRIDSRVGFRFRPGNLLVRWREVTYENIRPVSRQDIGPLEEIAEERSSFGSRLRQGFRRQLMLSAPGFIRSRLRGSGGRHLDRIVRSDVVLLLAPVSDVLRVDSISDDDGETDISELVRHRSYLDVYDDICEVCSRSAMPTVYVVVPDARLVLDAYDRGGGITSEHFIGFLRKDVLGLRQYCRVVPVDRDGEDRQGYDELLRLL